MTTDPFTQRVRYTRIARFCGILAIICMLLSTADLGLALDGDWGYLPISLMWGVSSPMWLWHARRYITKARRQKSPELSSLTECRALTYSLYLRPFAEDDRLAETDPLVRGRRSLPYGRLLGFADFATAEDSWEEQIVGLFRPCGEVIAVGHPDMRLALPGAKRFRLPRDDWQGPVSVGMERARLVLLVAGIGEHTGSARGTLWEFTEAVRLLPPSRLLLLVCGEPEDYRRFCEAAAATFEETSERLSGDDGTRLSMPVMPRHPLPDKAEWGHPLRGVVQFDDTWTGHFVAFDPTAEKGAARRRKRAVVRHQIEPLIARLESRLPGEARSAGTFRHADVAYTLLTYALSFGFAGWTVAHTQAPYAATVLAIAALSSVFLGEVRTAISTERERVRRDIEVHPPPSAPAAG